MLLQCSRRYSSAAGFRALGFLVVSILAGAPSLLGQREPVLKQIKVPHNYYYREMYLPQATSGPTSPTWSPDGQELIYSMQGSLWRQRAGDSIAVQLTDGDGYDYQPDWSPDGRAVVYASYRHDAIELRVLDLQTRLTRPILADGAVNVEPRWSPDGKRLTYVSTAFEGRWHVWVAERADSAVIGGGDETGAVRPLAVELGNIRRVTGDTNPNLPRYYYGKFDQYLSPTWSPDGNELLLISNRGHIHGSGGFWRLAPPDLPVADPSPDMREIRYEETTWKARPDWSRDGHRIVYSSYLGRQWNQLWLMTADGGDPLQLTYGEFDATEPRWSPDGRRIAYISNEDGNTSLWTVTVPGGARVKMEIRQRRYLGPTGRVRVVTVDARSGRQLPARISLTLPDGRSVVPDAAWRHADDGFDRKERPFEIGYFHSNGSAIATAPAGALSLEVVHGPEFRVVRRTLRITADSLVTVRVGLERIADPAAKGWTSGDLHIHMNYGGHYKATPATLALQARAEDLTVAENLIVNKEGRIPDIGYFTGRPDPVSTPDFLLVHDQEFHTSYWGHTGLLGLTRNVILPGYAAYANTPAASLYPDNGAVADLGHAQGALFGYVHPFDEYPNPLDTSVALTDALPVDVATGKVDYYEVVGFSDHLSSSRVWYQLLNCGFRLPAGAGTDAMTNFASLRGPVGTNRVYVHAGAPLDQHRWLAALKSGRSFATNGPLLEFSLDSAAIGGELRLAGPRLLRARVRLRSIVPIDHFEIVHNGEVAATIKLSGDRTHADTTIAIRADASGWYVLRAWSDQAEEPVLDIYPFASTSPIYVTVAGKPVRSAKDAAYFLAWLGRLTTAAESHTGYNTPEEKRIVLSRIEAARAEFERRAH
ncbi:MAG: CehA/McbA family metallohydrolase [Gemmatimonadota bacterium]